MKEIAALQLLQGQSQHSNVEELEEAMADDTTLYKVTPWYEGGELFDLAPMPEDAAKAVFSQLLDALDFVHSRGTYDRMHPLFTFFLFISHYHRAYFSLYCCIYGSIAFFSRRHFDLDWELSPNTACSEVHQHQRTHRKNKHLSGELVRCANAGVPLRTTGYMTLEVTQAINATYEYVPRNPYSRSSFLVISRRPDYVQERISYHE